MTSRIGNRVLLAGMLVSLFGCGPFGRDRIVEIGKTDQARLARSIGIIRNGTAAHPGVLRVLFYGQSITSTKWTDAAAAHLAKTYPNTRFIVRNMAIGGNDSPLLERAADRDLADFYPDLVIFHVYGDDRAYERIIRIIRSRTAAEVIVQTDHVRFPPEPMCPEGLHFGLDTPPGCRGTIWLRQRVWDDHMSGAVIPRLALRYGLAVDPRRQGWNAYLIRHKLAPDELLADGLHPNDRGWQLAAVLFDDYFDRTVAGWRGEVQTLVTAMPRPSAGAAAYSFTGNRVEIVSSAPLSGPMIVRFDGRDPRSIDGCWQTTRTSPVPAIPDWPAIRRVTIDRSYHRADRWTATATGFDAAQDDFSFTVVSSVSGRDGTGRGKQDFVSRSGRVSIAAQDWAFAYAAVAKQVTVPQTVTVRWEQGFACGAQAPVELGGGRREYRYVVATGLANTRHRLTLSLDPATASQVREIRAYRPPLIT